MDMLPHSLFGMGFAYISPTFRRMGLAANLMVQLEEVSTSTDTYFVDLFVRSSNNLAISSILFRAYISVQGLWIYNL